MLRRVAPLALASLVFVSLACGGSNDSKADSTTSRPASGASSTTTAGGTTTTGPAEPTGGDVLPPGDAPAPWTEASGDALALDELTPADVGSAAVSCPSSLPSVAGETTQCTAYADEGGPYVGIDVRANGGEQRVTLYCQDGSDKTFVPALTIAGRVAAGGPGASNGKGRYFNAMAVEVSDSVHWFVVRRPAGQDCPVVWDLGVDDGSLAASSSIGGATFPLAGGPSCTLLVAEGLMVKPGRSDGICA